MKKLLSDAVGRLIDHTPQWAALIDSRLPRWVVVSCTGASLAVSGALMQALFQNPFASPMVLGVSSGGSLFVLLLFASGLHLYCPCALSIAALAGSMSFLFLCFVLTRHRQCLSITRVLLTGIALSTMTLAVQGALLYALRHNWELIQWFTEWESGSSVDRNWRHLHLQLPLTLVGLYAALYYKRELNLLALGEEEALNLGVDVRRVRNHLFLATALLVGGALAAMGIIGFFGLLLPHILRKIVGPNHSSLLPACVVGGAAALVSLDALLYLGKLHIFSLGTLSAIFGGGLFFVLLMRDRSVNAH